MEKKLILQIDSKICGGIYQTLCMSSLTKITLENENLGPSGNEGKQAIEEYPMDSPEASHQELNH